MGGAPPISINTQSGFISGTPTMLGQYVVGVCVEEYRNGVLLSTVRRDFQFNVADCSPTVIANILSDSIAGPQQYVVSSCGQNSVTFLNQSVQQQFIDEFVWNFDIDGTPYSNSSDWDPTVAFPDTGTYHGTLYLNPGQECGDTAEITVNIYPSITASYSFAYDTCEAGPVVFTDASFGDAGIDRWRWNFGVQGGTSTDQHPEFLYPIPGDHSVTLRVYDSNNCSDDTTQVVNWYPVPPLIIIEPSTFAGCAPADIFFDNLSSPIDSTYDIRWDFGDGGTTSGVISPNHLYTETGVFTVHVEITSPIGCYTEDTFVDLIKVVPSPTADFTFSPDTLLSNFNNTVQFTDLSSGANRWNWQFGNEGTTTQQNPLFTFQDTGLVAVRLIVTHPEGCKDSITQLLDIVPEFKWFMPNAFTPNGDGSNDLFLGAGLLEGINDFNMTIWNRWGELVFETDNPNVGWNGQDQNSGSMSPGGVYVYQVTFTSPRGTPLIYKGFATLIR
jgi:gliding motility-associated-like protein